MLKCLYFFLTHCSDWSADWSVKNGEVRSSQRKARTTNKTFQEQCPLWERLIPFGLNFGLYNSADLLHAKYITHSKEGENLQKHKMASKTNKFVLFVLTDACIKF